MSTIVYEGPVQQRERTTKDFPFPFLSPFCPLFSAEILPSDVRQGPAPQGSIKDTTSFPQELNEEKGPVQQRERENLQKIPLCNTHYI